MSNNINIYVISLLYAIDRRQRILDTFNNFKQQYILFDAVDGSNKELIKQLRNKYNISRISDYESACAISHIMVLEQFLKTNDNYVIILEDDAILLDKLPTTDNEILLMLKDINVNNFDILFIHNSVKYNYNTYKVTKGHGTYGYIFSREGAKKTIQSLFPLNTQIDIQIINCGQKNKLNIYRSRLPYIAHDNNNKTYIPEKTGYNYNKLVKPLIIGLILSIVIGGSILYIIY